MFKPLYLLLATLIASCSSSNATEPYHAAAAGGTASTGTAATGGRTYQPVPGAGGSPSNAGGSAGTCDSSSGGGPPVPTCNPTDTAPATLGSAQSCNVAIPSQPGGGSLDFANLNLWYVVSNCPIALMEDPGCAHNTNSWEYDNPSNPTAFVLCPSTCAMAQANTNSAFTVEFNCPTTPY